MNNEEKILAMLEKLNGTVEKHSEMLAQMQADIFGMQGDITGLKAGQAQMQGDITSIKARLDYDVNKRFDSVNEGIDTILETLAPKNRVEALEDEMTFMKSVIKSMSQRISELEKAQ